MNVRKDKGWLLSLSAFLVAGLTLALVFEQPVIAGIFEQASACGSGLYAQSEDGAGAFTCASVVLFPFSCTIPSATGLVNAATEYYNPQAQCPSASNEANVDVYIPLAGVARNLFAAVQQDPGTGNSWTFTVHDSGMNSLTCTITGTAGMGFKSCSDLTHTETIGAGDVISVRVELTGSFNPSGWVLMSFAVYSA